MVPTRRQFLAGGATAALVGLAGCSLINPASHIEGVLVDNSVDGLVVEDISQNFTGTSEGRALVVVVRVGNESDQTFQAESVCADIRYFDADDEALDGVTVPLPRELPPGESELFSHGYTDRPDDVARYTVELSRC